MNNWHKLSISDVSFESGTDVKYGRANVDPKRSRVSNNRIFNVPRVDSRRIFRHMLSDASLILLLFTLFLNILTGSIVESISGIIFLVFVFTLGCYFKYRSSGRIINSYSLTLPQAKVTENGIKRRLSVFDVEVGDLIEFSQGDVIPADARLVSSVDLRVAERATDPSTGKIVYIPREKDADSIITDVNDHELLNNTVYAGSMVVSGKGSAIVHSIGTDTKLCSIYGPIVINGENDIPAYLKNFYSVCKKLSLFTLIGAIPITIISLYTQTLNPTVSTADRNNLLYLFLIVLSLSVTCMSELVISPAETLITKDIFPTSRKRGRNYNQSRVTKLSSAEAFADVDTVLIMCPDVLRDSEHLVRRVYFDSKDFRLESLKSAQLSEFLKTVSSIYGHFPKSKLNKHVSAIRAFSLNHNKNSNIEHLYVNNYPIKGAISRVLKQTLNKEPLRFLTQCEDVSILALCSHIRTEGNGIWAINQDILEAINSAYNSYVSDSLKISIITSKDEKCGGLIFEGIIATGEEFPYYDHDLFDEYNDSGITPILVFQSETSKNLEFAIKCGIISNMDEIALASNYYRSGLTISDAPSDTKVYIGFGRNGTSELISRLLKSNHRILPIIKDSAQRFDIKPLDVYATHTIESHETVKLATSLNLKPVNANTKSGGLYDTLVSLRGSSLARIKLGSYKNYLIYAAVSRMFIVALPMLLGLSNHVLSSFMILLSGFLCDFIALWALMNARGNPIQLKNSASEAKRMFSSTLGFIYVVLAIISSSLSVFTSIYLTSSKLMIASSASTFLMISLICNQLASLAGLLMIVKSKTRGSGVNKVYLISLSIVTLLILTLTALPKSISETISSVGIHKIELKFLPYLFISCTFIIIGSLVISKLISNFGTKNH